MELLEYVKIGMCVYSVAGRKGDVINLNPVRDILDEIKMDPDQLCSLVAEVVPQSSCLVFCPTKKNCQNVALLLAKYLPKYGKLSLLRMFAIHFIVSLVHKNMHIYVHLCSKELHDTLNKLHVKIF